MPGPRLLAILVATLMDVLTDESLSIRATAKLDKFVQLVDEAMSSPIPDESSFLSDQSFGSAIGPLTIFGAHDVRISPEHCQSPGVAARGPHLAPCRKF